MAKNAAGQEVAATDKAAAAKTAKGGAKQDAAAAEKDKDAKPKKGKWFKVMMILLLLGGGGGGGAWYFMQGQPAAGEAAAEKPKEKTTPPVFVTLEPFTVNLQPEEGAQYLQVGLVLKVSDSTDEEAVKQHMPEIRNRILLLLSSKRGSELTSVEGKQKLSTEIVAQVRQLFAPQEPEEGVTNVFFTSFVIQ